MATNEEIKESIKLLDDQRKGLDKNSDQYKLLSRAISELNENLAISVDYLKQQEEQLQLQKGTLEIIAQQTGITVDLRRKGLEVREAELATQIKEKEEQIKSTENVDKKRKLQEELVNLLKDQTKEIEKQKDLTRAETQGKALANLLGISEANKNSLTYQIFSDPKSVFDGFKKEVDDAGGIVKAVSVSLLMKIQEASIAAFYAADKAYSGFAAATGASSAYNQVITATARGNTALGISFEQSSRAVADLYSNLNTFSTLTQSTQEELTVTTAKLEELGISGGDTAKSIQSLSITMGITELQAAKTVERFAAMGMAIGVSSKQMIYDFMSVKESLAAFGSAMDKTFTDLAAQAKATGVAVSELLTLANKFDTFEGAATQVGKLNAILGGPYLSAMAMIENTDPTSRIEMLRQAVSNAGMSFDSMTYYQKKAIAEAGGFKSVDEAQRILSMSAGEAAAELENQAKSQEELNKAIERAQPIQEKLTMIMANFAIVIEPLVTGVSELLTKIIKFQDENKEAATYVGYLIGGLVTLTLVITTLKFLFFGLSAVIGLFSTSSNTAGASGKIASVGIRSIGAAIVSVGKAASSPQVLAGLALVSAFLVAVGIAAFGMGYGLKMAAEGFASLIKEAVKAPEVFLTLGVAILALAAAITVLSLNPFVLVGMGVLLASFYGIADALNSIDTEKVINFKTVMEKSVEISAPDNVKGFEAFAEKFELVGKATNELNASNAQTFLNMINATQSLTQTLAVNQNITVKIGDKEINAIIDERIQVDKRRNNMAFRGGAGN